MSNFFPARLWLLCMLLAAPFLYNSRAVEKIIRHPIVTDYTVHSPEFQ